MNKITELKTLQDLHDHKYAIFSPNPPLYLYEYIRDVGEIKRGTLQLAVAWRIISRPISPYEASNMRLNVHYQMSPSDLEFSRTVDMYPEVALFQDVRVFYLGDIGYELIKSSPEQVAKKYFGSSDFSKFFLYISNRADFNERMSLEYANKRNLVPPNALAAAKQVPLLGTHHHSLPPKMSTVQKYLKAAKQSFYDDVPRHSTLYDTMVALPLTIASFGTYSHSPKVSAASGALALVPLARIIHKYKKDIDKDEIPIDLLQAMNVNLIDGTQVYINIKELLLAGNSPDEIEAMLDINLKAIDQYIEDIDFYVNVDDVAKTVQPITDQMLKDL